MPSVRIEFGREICGVLPAAESREWLVTNGIGGFASGTIAGRMTRRYHGLLIAALQPPVARTYLVAGLDETARYDGADYALATQGWLGGAINPQGFRNIENFRLEGTQPVWTYALADALLEKRICMRHGENTTFIQYRVLRASAPVQLQLKTLVNYRDMHASTHAGNWAMQIKPEENGIAVTAFPGAAPFYLKCAGAACEPRHEWYRDFFLPAEAERGLDAREDHLLAAVFRATLPPGGSLTMVATTESQAAPGGDAETFSQSAREEKLLATWQARREDLSLKAPAPGWIPQLVLAAGQFIVKRSLPGEPDGRSVIAGYHWFCDWGRDTMIALPGLTLATGRPEVAREILLAFARYVDGGMMPNNFPDSGGKPDYNTVDAALWYFEAARQYFAATQDRGTLDKIFPVLAAMIDAHVKGTRYNIHADPADGLLYAGGPGVQLTWMDAKVGDWVVTPRTGKPVEINALWINALATISGFAQLLTKPREGYDKLAAKAAKSFQKFWNEKRNCCFDVIDSPGIGLDPALRPNQIFAVSLPVSPLTAEQRQSVVDICARQLLTSFGLRSLSPGEAGYIGHYSGGVRERDAAYHQGPVWGWLLGPFALAHLRVYGDRAAAMRFLEPLGNSLGMYGLGTLPEIFDGDAPFTPKGCIAQAWTVAEVLRAADVIQNG